MKFSQTEKIITRKNGERTGNALKFEADFYTLRISKFQLLCRVVFQTNAVHTMPVYSNIE